jgi:hypothetical protein
MGSEKAEISGSNVIKATMEELTKESARPTSSLKST